MREIYLDFVVLHGVHDAAWCLRRIMRDGSIGDYVTALLLYEWIFQSP
jgi:hypothetical protein